MMLQHDWNSSHIHLCKAKAVPVCHDGIFESGDKLHFS